MPIHDWTRVKPGIFHDFHHEWISETKRAVNRGLRGSDYYALAEQVAGSLGPDVLTLQRPLKAPATARKPRSARPSAAALLRAKPKLRFHIKDEKKWYANKKKAVTIRHVSDHRIVAVFEIVSPGNKSSRSVLSLLVHKAQDLLSAGIHLSIVDLFPPAARDPEGIHPLIWGDDDDDVFHFDPAKPLTCAAYVASAGAEAFVEPVAVGDKLPNLPLYLTPEEYVEIPLEETYQAAFEAVPDFWREAVESAWDAEGRS